MNNKIIDISKTLNDFKEDIYDLSDKKESLKNDVDKTSNDINQLMNDINSLISETQVPIDYLTPNNEDSNIVADFNTNFHNEITNLTDKVKSFPDMSALDVIICCISGAVASAIDILLVGKPKLVGKQHEFTGSILTNLLRQINGDSGFFKYLSDKCKVPYDLSCLTKVVTPNNHRLRSLAHDPLFGLIFAIVDIFCGTTTCINDNGILEIIPTKKSTLTDKIFAVLLYIGHIISDICTSRGLPIPGSFLTQINFNNAFLKKISSASKSMYINGYDCRHLLSMSSSVEVSHFIINSYLEIVKPVNNIKNMYYENELQQLENKLKTTEMMLLSDSIASMGNALKIFLPPDSGNLTAINLV
ncbi:MAG: hypothetical protein K2N60_06635, partial [Oscillospiraceae bacterium]|nr:hypothetical protein [Oscillospiraceae bacterium]